MSVLLSLVHLQSFDAVAERGSFSQAASLVGYSQPAVSLHVRALERDLHTRLFRRDCHGSVLTDDAQAFLECARETVEELLRLQSALRAAVPPTETNEQVSLREPVAPMQLAGAN